MDVFMSVILTEKTVKTTTIEKHCQIVFSILSGSGTEPRGTTVGWKRIEIHVKNSHFACSQRYKTFISH
jgi:hypothetical protein